MAKKKISASASFLDEFTKLDDDFVIAADSNVTFGTIDTGSYMLNALLSGSIYGGARDNKITGFAGPASTGKTYFVLGIAKHFLDSHPENFVVLFDSEFDMEPERLAERGLDIKRVIVSQPATVEDWRSKAVKMLTAYTDKNRTGSGRMMMILDSLGNLSTTKETADIEVGKESRDMTKSQLVKGAFRVLTLKLAKAKVPMFITNHVYDMIGSYVPTKKMGSGTGLDYAGSQIIFLSKGKERDEKTKTTIGSIIKAVTHKSRLTREDQKTFVKLDFDRGLDRYYGLLEFGVETGVLNKGKAGRNQLAYAFGNNEMVLGVDIDADPASFFTKEVLDAIEIEANKTFLYGSSLDSDVSEDVDFLVENSVDEE